MSCDRWNNEWVAHLYDELSEGEESILREHLAECPDCRATMEELEGSRAALRDACPEVPSRPAVIVLRPASRFRPFWAWVASAACAIVVFASGLAAGRLGAPSQRLPHDVAQTPAAGATEGATPAAFDGATRDELVSRIADLSSRLDAIEQGSGKPSAADTASNDGDPWLTKAEFLEAMQRHERRADLKRSRDYEFVLSQIAAAEWRTGTQIGETREALNWVALRSDPRLSER
jgi:hypothetical protein